MHNQHSIQEIETQAEKNCKVTVFLESHDDKNPGTTLGNLLPFFKTQGFNSFCLEDSKREKEASLKAWQKSAENYSSPLCLIELQIEKGLSFEEAWKDCTKIADAMHAKVKLLESLEEHNMQYCAMDMAHERFIPSDNAQDNRLSLMWTTTGDLPRDIHMAQEIEQSCHKGDVLVLVGAEHYTAIRSLLIRHGVEDVRGYYMPSNTPPPSKPWITYDENGTSCYHPLMSGFARLEGPMRSSDFPPYAAHKDNNLVVIDLFKDGSQNTTDLVQQDYLNYVAGTQAEYVDDEL